MRIIYFLFSFFLFASIQLNAQAPQIVDLFPNGNRIDVPSNSFINISFDIPIDLATVDYSNFRVFGRWSGPMEVSFSMANNNRSVTLTPFDTFFAGEWVTVTLGKGIKSEAGEEMGRGYSWHFYIQTQPGSLIQNHIKTIELRIEGEGLLQTYGAYAGDLNNDGFTDLTVVNETSDDLRILLNDGQGDYNDFEILDMGMEKPSPNEGGDFDEDGEIDLVVTSVQSDDVRLLLGDGEGSFSDQQDMIAGDGARGVVVLDLNGDASDDIVIVNRNASNITTMINNTDGTFETNTIKPYADGIGETSCAIGDMNKDGLTDLFVGYYNSREIAILLSDGMGNFTLGDVIVVPGRPWMLVSGDFNGDGNIDVASANSNDNSMTVIPTNENGIFLNPVNYNATDQLFPLAIDAGDIDGDNDLDIVLTNYSSNNYVVYGNMGNGIFEFKDALSGVELASCAILHDRDNDGDLDITGTDEGADVVLLFLNGPPTNVEDLSAANFSIQLTPNPFQEVLSIQFELENKSDVQIQVNDILGQKKHTILKDRMDSGKHQLLFGNKIEEQLIPGIYFLEMIINKQNHSQSFIKN